MKTQLPEKFLGNIISENEDGTRVVQMTNIESVINQLITYLAELTEVVEGKRERNETRCPQCLLENNNGVCDRKDCSNHQPELAETPTLKETLLKELKKARYWHSQGKSIDWEDVEAIINRLMP